MAEKPDSPSVEHCKSFEVVDSEHPEIVDVHGLGYIPDHFESMHTLVLIDIALY